MSRNFTSQRILACKDMERGKEECDVFGDRQYLGVERMKSGSEKHPYISMERYEGNKSSGVLYIQHRSVAFI